MIVEVGISSFRPNPAIKVHHDALLNLYKTKQPCKKRKADEADECPLTKKGIVHTPSQPPSATSVCIYQAGIRAYGVYPH